MSLKEENPHLYQLAKQMVLGLQFGMGPERFAEVLRKAGIVEPPSWREAINCFDPGPTRSLMLRMFSELERIGVEITMTVKETHFRVKEASNLEKARRIFHQHLPKTSKVICFNACSVRIATESLAALIWEQVGGW
jgi:hypothetical protein